MRRIGARFRVYNGCLLGAILTRISKSTTTVGAEGGAGGRCRATCRVALLLHTWYLVYIIVSTLLMPFGCGDGRLALPTPYTRTWRQVATMQRK